MSASYLLSGCRTPIGKFLGSLSKIPATELGSTVVGEAVRRAAIDPEIVDEVILGNVLSAGLGQAPAHAHIPGVVQGLSWPCSGF